MRAHQRAVHGCEESVIKGTAAALAKGEAVGRMQGRMDMVRARAAHAEDVEGTEIDLLVLLMVGNFMLRKADQDSALARDYRHEFAPD